MNRLIPAIAVVVASISLLGTSTIKRPRTIQVVLVGNDTDATDSVLAFCPGAYQSANGTTCIPRNEACDRGLLTLELKLQMQLQAAATNAANYMTIADEKFNGNRPYRRRVVVVRDNHPRFVEDQTPFPVVYRPGNPFAGKDGFLKVPNIDPITELVDYESSLVRYKVVCRLLREFNASYLAAPPPAFPYSAVCGAPAVPGNKADFDRNGEPQSSGPVAK